TVAVGLTLTRISLVSLLAGALLISLMRAERKTIVRILVGFIIVTLVGVHWINQRRALTVFNTADPGTQYRLLMWRDSLKLIRAHPLVGVGLDSISGDWHVLVLYGPGTGASSGSAGRWSRCSLAARGLKLQMS